MTTAPIRPTGRPRLAARITALGLALLLFFTAGAGVAAAHVTVNPDTVTAGSWAKLTFRVPTESDTASTVALQVHLPDEHPFPSVSVMPVPGWTASVTKTALDPPVTEGRFTLTEAVTSITWTADDGVGIKPGEFMEFPISVGPVPDVPALEFPADQTYSDDSVVHWDDPWTAGGDEPDHPAPRLTIGGAEQSGAAGDDETGQATGPTVTGSVDADHPAGTDGTARVLAVIALVLAAVALLVAVLGMRRPRRGTPRPPQRGPRSEPSTPPEPPSPPEDGR